MGSQDISTSYNLNISEYGTISTIPISPVQNPKPKGSSRSKILVALLQQAINTFNKSTHDMINGVHDRTTVSTSSSIRSKPEIFLKNDTWLSAAAASADDGISKVRITSGLEDHEGEFGAIMVLAAILFTFGLLANLAVIGRVLRQGVLRARIRMLLLSLSCADVLLMLLEFPLNQFAWLSLRVWKAGDFMCRASAFTRAFAAYLISFILVVISLDRCLNTVKPVAPKASSRRMKKLLWSALAFAFVCAMPQWLVFHTSPIPNDPNSQYQCVSRGLVDNDNMVKVVYPIFCMICQYIIPIVLISLDYTIILYAMSKPVGQSDFQKLISFRPIQTTNTSNTQATTQTSGISTSSSNITVASHNSTRHSSSHDSYIRKAQMKTLRILLITVAVFAMCWLPYYVVLLFYVGNPSLANQTLPYWVFKLTELTAVSNACLNPFIYGNYLLKVKERCKSCWPY